MFTCTNTASENKSLTEILIVHEELRYRQAGKIHLVADITDVCTAVLNTGLKDNSRVDISPGRSTFNSTFKSHKVLFVFGVQWKRKN